MSEGASLMRADTRQAIYVALNFVFAPAPSLDRNSHLKLQQALSAEGVDYTDCQRAPNIFTVTRTGTPPLQVRIALVPPAPIAQLVIESENIGGVDREYFCKDAEAVVTAFGKTWPETKQMLSVDATLRDLFESSEQHAFAEIWEKRLGREAAEFAGLGPVMGGGFRLLVPPLPTDSDPQIVDIVIESFLADPKKMYLQASFKWPKPLNPGAPMQPVAYVERAEKYVREKLVPFMNQGVEDDIGG